MVHNTEKLARNELPRPSRVTPSIGVFRRLQSNTRAIPAGRMAQDELIGAKQGKRGENRRALNPRIAKLARSRFLHNLVNP
ncbi:MAG: hypothetical protein JWL77_6976 [Chthonomonadaceae bacterium]|nr:hypothetical protein [Chthonomonadaceae bacterium]